MDIERIIREVTAEVKGSHFDPVPDREAFHTAAAEMTLCRSADITGHLEHSAFCPELTRENLEQACSVVRKYEAAAICVRPDFVLDAADALRGSNSVVAAAIGFPGEMPSQASRFNEARECIRSGAKELDVAVNVAAIKEGRYEDAAGELSEIVDLALNKAKVKVVLEEGRLTETEKLRVIAIAKECHVDYISLWYPPVGRGACPDEVRRIRGIVGTSVGIKVEGGVSTLATAREMLAAGADRVGLTATELVAKEAFGSC